MWVKWMIIQTDRDNQKQQQKQKTKQIALKRVINRKLIKKIDLI